MNYAGDFPQSWLTNIKEIDDDHRHLYEMLNSFVSNKEPTAYVEREFLDMFLAELMNHCEKEEHMMVLNNYPDAENHKSHHRKVIKHLLSLRHSDMSAVDVAKECQKAFIRDLLVRDIPFKEFMQNKKAEA
ncbi:bacteriohemerythrin [Kordiimonas lipolytica]|uniref:Bacteriohemerythrin n=1 Tax=Kordiimonas lipolytica TaxID=1662421 RepID=A0ABV8UB81_9PROT|nr:hemerythrin domain-containing protein [Kordiimonas lipolytica]